jgi:hypothetical protein
MRPAYPPRLRGDHPSSISPSTAIRSGVWTVGQVRVRVTGSRRRYLADFTAGQAPVVQQMSREENAVAGAMAQVGLPPAVVSRLPDSTSDDEPTHVIEVPPEALRLAR